MIDRLAELCDRVAELEAENARLAQEIKELAAWKLENERVRIEESIVDMNKQLAATVAQLREAIEDALDELGAPGVFLEQYAPVVEAVTILRAALGGS